MRTTGFIASTILVVMLMGLTGFVTWEAAKSYYADAPVPVKIGGQTVMVTPGSTLRYEVRTDKSQIGPVGTDRSSQLAKAPDLVFDGDVKGEHMATAPNQKTEKDITGATKADQTGSDTTVEWVSVKPYTAIVCAVIGSLVILGAIGAYVYAKQPLSTCAIIAGGGVGIIIAGQVAQDITTILVAVGALGVLCLAVWFVLGRKGATVAKALGYIAPAIEALEKVRFTADTQLDDNRWAKPEVDTVAAGSSVAEYVKAQIAQEVPRADTAEVKAVVTEAKTK